MLVPNEQSPPSPRLQEPVKRLLESLNSGAPRHLIGLVGLPGAGKSTLARELEQALNLRANATAMVALGMDGFHLTKAQLNQFPNPEAALARRGAPWTFDPQSLIHRLQELREPGDRPVFWPDFQHEVGEPVQDAIQVSPDVPIVLIEGLYLLHQGHGWDALQEQFNECWYLDTPLEVALERLIRRHMQAWGIRREEAKRRIATNDRLNAEIVFESRVRADAKLWEDSPGENTDGKFVLTIKGESGSH